MIDHAWVAGARTRFAARLRLQEGTDSFGIFFGPSDFSQLFGIPMGELTNRLGNAAAIGVKDIRILWNRLAEIPSFEDRVRIAEEFLLCRVSRARSRGKIAVVANYVFAKHGAVTMNELVCRGSMGL